MAPLQLTSPAFEDGEPIPREYGSTERNVNPPLEIDGVPDEADALALVVDDPDAVEPAGATKDDLLGEVADHVVDKATLEGTCAP